MGGWVRACRTRIPRAGFYFLSRPVLSSPPSVRRPAPHLAIIPRPFPPSCSPPSLPRLPRCAGHPACTHRHTHHSLQRFCCSSSSYYRARALLVPRPLLAWLVEPRGWWRGGAYCPREEIGDAGGRVALGPVSVQRDHLAVAVAVVGPPGPMW